MNEINENVSIYKFMDIHDKKESYLKIRELGKKLLEKNLYFWGIFSEDSF